MNKIVDNIILLRHEERGLNPEFNSHLTDLGLTRRHDIINRLNKMGYRITTIYSSPYLRCLQTILPLSEKLQLKVNVEYSLAEWFNQNDAVGRNTVPRSLTSNETITYRAKPSYQSLIKNTDIVEHETEIQLKNRISRFMEYLNDKETDNNGVILITGHLSILNEICNYLGYHRDLEDHFIMGSLIKPNGLNTLQEF